MRLRGAYSFFRRRANLALAPLGMSSDQFVLLAVLAKNGPATQQELVRRCHSDATTLGAMLVLLETKGLVKRKAHARDGRSWIVSLSKAGEALQKDLWNCGDSVRAELEVLFSPGEKRLLLELLDRIIEAMRPQRRRTQKPAHSRNGQLRKRIAQKIEANE